jgi:hypothetical protein
MATKKTEAEKKIAITIDGYDAEQVKTWIANRVERAVEEGLDRRVDEALKEAAQSAIDGMADRIAKERVTKEITDILAEGWTQTDSYGNATGKKYTLRERVRGFFDTKADSYDRQTRVEKWIAEAVQRELATVLKAEVESAQKRLRDAFDDVLKLKFADTMRKMLGVEPK